MQDQQQTPLSHNPTEPLTPPRPVVGEGGLVVSSPVSQWDKIRYALWPAVGGTGRKRLVAGTAIAVVLGIAAVPVAAFYMHRHTAPAHKSHSPIAQASPNTPEASSSPDKKPADKPTDSTTKPSAPGSSPAGGSTSPGSPSSGGTGGGGNGGGNSGGGGGGGGDPAPTPGPATCPAYPSFPTTSCTGWQHTGVTLTTVNGIYYATTAGAVLDSKDFRDGVVVEADNVTIKRSKVEGKGSGPGAGIWVNQGVSGTLIEDVEVTSQAGFDPNNEATIVDRAITGFKTSGLTMRRVYAHNMIRGLQYGCDTLIEDSYVDDEINPTGAHMSGIGGETCSNFTLTVRHNNIGLAPNVNDSAALLFYPPQVGAYGTQNLNVTFQNNLIYGGTYCMWLSSDPQFTGAVTVTGNQFGTKYYSSCGLYGTHFKDNWGSEGSATMTWSNNTKGGSTITF